MRVLFAIATLVPAALGAQGAKAAAPKAGPITAGGSSTARTVAEAPAPAAASAKPGAAPATPATPAAPATVAAKPGTKPATPPTVAAKPVPPAALPAKGAAVVAAGAAAAAAAAAATKPGAAPAPAATPAKGAATPTVATGATPASAPASAQSATGASITIDRELYTYERGGRRDPFSSLLQSDDLKPAVSDLKLIGVVLDPRGRNSIAVMRDLSTKELYRVRPGQSVGRLRVTQISQRSVTFLIEEFGVTRQETLSLKDANTVRNP